MSGKIKIVFSFLILFSTGNSYSEDLKGSAMDTRLEADLCVYCASGAGTAASFAAAPEGYSVVIIKPVHKIGGLIGSGFRKQHDVPYAGHLGALTGAYYALDMAQPQPQPWHQQGDGKFNIAALQTMIDQYKNLIRDVTDH